MAAATTWTSRQGKPRTFGSGHVRGGSGSTPSPAGKRYRVRFKAPTGDGEQWKTGAPARQLRD